MRENPDEDPINGFEVRESRAEGLFHAATILDSSRRLDLEGEAGLATLSHHAVHSRWVALHVDLSVHFQYFPIEHLLPFFAVRVRL